MTDDVAPGAAENAAADATSSAGVAAPVTLRAADLARAARIAAGATAGLETSSLEQLKTLSAVTATARLTPAGAAALSQAHLSLAGPVTAQLALSAPMREAMAAAARLSEDSTRRLFAGIDVAAPLRAVLADVGRTLAAHQRSAVSELVRTSDFNAGARLATMLRSAGLADLPRSTAAQLIESAGYKAMLAEFGRSVATRTAVSDPAWLRFAQGAQLAAGLSSVAHLANSHQSLLNVRGLADGVTGYLGSQQAITALAGSDHRPVLRGLSLPATLPANSYLGSLRERSPRRRIELAGYLAHGAAGAVVGEALGAAGLTGDERDGLADTAQRLVMAPWQHGRELARRDLFTALQQVFPYAVELLDGAWHNIITAGPAAATSASHCLVEAFDQTLRALAPDVDVDAWVAASGRPRKDMYSDKGQLTRRARIAFVLRHRSQRDRQAVLGLEAALSSTSAATLGELQSGKHDGRDVTVAVVRLHALLIEDVLMQLLLTGDGSDCRG